jgi:hypothetical protein
MATRDDQTVQGAPAADAALAPRAAGRYEPPRILRKRSVVDATLQVVSGGCDPSQPGCGVGGH